MARSPSARVVGTPRWRRLRAKILDRDGYRCSRCGRAGKLEVDHVKPVSCGGAPFDPLNLQALCRRCHFAKTATENLRRPRAIPPEVLAWDNLVIGIEKMTV